MNIKLLSTFVFIWLFTVTVFDLNANIIFSDTTFVLSKSEIVPDLSPKANPSEINFNFASSDAQFKDFFNQRFANNPVWGYSSFDEFIDNSPVFNLFQ